MIKDNYTKEEIELIVRENWDVDKYYDWHDSMVFHLKQPIHLKIFLIDNVPNFKKFFVYYKTDINSDNLSNDYGHISIFDKRKIWNDQLKDIISET